MTRGNHPAGLNRSLLALLGLALLACGGLALATHFGWQGLFTPAASLTPGTNTPPTWALYVITLVAVTLGLLCLGWLAAQLDRPPRGPTWRLEDKGSQGRIELAARIAVEPFVDEIRTYPGVDTAHATLAGSRQTPTLAVVIKTSQDADLTAIRHRLSTDGLPRLRQALDLPALPVTTEFQFTTRTGTTVR